MISRHLIAKYGIWDVAADIDGFQRAMADSHWIYSPFHRLHLCQFGYVSKPTLEKLGLWLNRPAREFVFVTKDELKEMVRQHKKAHPSSRSDRHYVTLKYWLLLHPDGDIRDITQEEFDTLRGSISRLHLIIREMRSRCHNPNSQNWQWYGGRGIGICKEWDKDGDDCYFHPESSQRFILWALKAGYVYRPGIRKGDQLSIHRKDHDKEYSPENCEWIPHRLNSTTAFKRLVGKSSVLRTALHRNTRLAREYPECRQNGNGFMDFKKFMDLHLDGDLEKLKEFLKAYGYTRPGIQAILRRMRSKGEIE